MPRVQHGQLLLPRAHRWCSIFLSPVITPPPLSLPSKPFLGTRLFFPTKKRHIEKNVHFRLYHRIYERETSDRSNKISGKNLHQKKTPETISPSFSLTRPTERRLVLLGSEGSYFPLRYIRLVQGVMAKAPPYRSATTVGFSLNPPLTPPPPPPPPLLRKKTTAAL